MPDPDTRYERSIARQSIGGNYENKKCDDPPCYCADNKLRGFAATERKDRPCKTNKDCFDIGHCDVDKKYVPEPPLGVMEGFNEYVLKMS